jgi:transposase-like protein
MTKNTTTDRAGEAEDFLFDSWFDPIEDGLRAKVRGFIETMIEEELTTALSRPRYGRRQDGAEAGVGVMGHRHGRRARRLTGTFGPTEIAVPRARLVSEDGTKSEWKSAALRAYQRRTLAADALIASTYLAGTNTRGAPRACGRVRRGRRQGRGQPGVAEGEDGLGCLESARSRLRTDRAAHPRRHCGARAARPQGDHDLAPGRHRRARGRAEGAARGQEHGRGDDRGLACCSRRPHRPGPAPAELPHRGRRTRARALAAVWDGVPTQRCTVHKHRNLLAHAPRRLHEEISADYTDKSYAATADDIEERRKAFLRKCRLRHRAVADSLEEAGEKLFAFARLPPSQWKSARTTNAIERLHEEFKRRIKTQTILPSAETAAMLFWALLAAGQIRMRKVDGWQSLAKPITEPLALAA